MSQQNETNNVFLQFDVSNVQDLTPAPDNTEAVVRLIDFKVGTDKQGFAYIMPSFELPEWPDAPRFNYFLGLPSAGREAIDNANKSRKLRNFCEAFGISLQGFNPAEEAARRPEAWALLGIEEATEEYAAKNRIKKFLRQA